MRLTYKTRLFIWLLIIFSVFVAGILTFDYTQNKNNKLALLQERLNTYAELAEQLYARGQVDTAAARLLPQPLRLTIVDKKGQVLYDNKVMRHDTLDNHLSRPEISQARTNNTGTDVRKSASTQVKYLYFARQFSQGYVRVALPYNPQIEQGLKPDNFFLGFTLLFFGLILFLLHMVSERFGQSIKQLHDFALSADSGRVTDYAFPKDELGEIGRKITELFTKMTRNRQKLALEREKLLQHVHSSEEGICFFTHSGEVQFYNSLFIQHLNLLSAEPNSDPTCVLTEERFASAMRFVRHGSETWFEEQMTAQGRVFSLHANRFEDGSFELILNDVTRAEKTKSLKREITGNIAHELRTPVTGIRGFLETIVEQNLTPEQQQTFIRQAYNRTIELSDIIEDISILNRLEEQAFDTEEVHICTLLDTIAADYEEAFRQNNVTFLPDVPEDTVVRGNYHLLYTIFRNLTDNAIRYAGTDITISVRLCKQDDTHLYFSFSDNGAGIADETHLSRIFERFYRVNEGRTRNTGGSGLGLSIVKNAVAFHKGSISAKNRDGGGLDILFHLHR